MKKNLYLLLTVIVIAVLAGCAKSSPENDIPIDEKAAVYVADTMPEETAQAAEAAAESIETEPPFATTSSDTPAEAAEPTAPAHVHEWTDTVVAPTCITDGYSTHVCNACGETSKDNIVKATGHTFSSWKTSREPTPSSAGAAERKCVNCGKVETRILDKLPENHTHSYSSSVTSQPTCTKAGVKTFICSCGDTYTEDIPKVDHSYSTTVVAPTCTTRGYTEHTCTVCKHIFKDTYVNALPHSYNNSVVAPTCGAEGYTSHTCKTCGYYYVDNKTSALGHKWGNWTITKEATENSVGTETRTCSRCSDTETQTIPKIDHTHSYSSRITTPASCLQTGIKTFTCTCGHKYTEVLPKTGHDWKDWVIDKEPTEKSDGCKSRTCKICNTVQEENIPKLPSQPTEHVHSWSTKETAPTCTQDGYITKTCFCGAKETVPSGKSAIGHQLYEVSRTSATCSSAGTISYACHNCNYTSSESYYGEHQWEHHHEDAVTEKRPKIVCHCGWSYPATGDYVSAFNDHVNSVPNEDRYNHSYYGSSDTVVITPAKDWDACSVCGATR